MSPKVIDQVQLNWLSATKLLRLILSGEVAVTEIVSSLLDQINRLDNIFKAWAYIDGDIVWKRAKEIEQNLSDGHRFLKLAGLPIGIKDIFNTSDMPTQMGSPIWKDFTPGNDARVVHNLRYEGAVFLGKTHTAEFGVHYQDITCNPHNIDFSPGTSSSGSAVAVAAGMVPVALATQTAGSIIRPAGNCGIYGFKPSFGLIPRTGILKTTDSLDTVGFMTRSVDDLPLVLDVMRTHGRNYEFVHKYIDTYQGHNKSFSNPWKVACLKHTKWSFVKDYANQQFESFINKLSGGKIIIEQVSLPDIFEQAHDVHQVIYDKTLAYYFKEEFKERTLISPIMYEIIERGNGISLGEYFDALEKQAQLREKFSEFMSSYDAMITLSTSGEAPKGLTTPEDPDSCLIWTLCGVPAVNVPAFTGPNGLPFGFQVVSRRYDDMLLLDFLKELKSKEIINDVSYSF